MVKLGMGECCEVHANGPNAPQATALISQVDGRRTWSSVSQAHGLQEGHEHSQHERGLRHVLVHELHATQLQLLLL